ncbi:LOW QUALITY PROTEIN: uncharacterized protein LOC142550746 [Primulina tabacum]|uniref:LOW QUALITY PROTEIN: uncharacterized protein LOC142550746 n=1 Tax=Primulina tabacum TaxID=48773 RepID=UPI003F597553
MGEMTGGGRGRGRRQWRRKTMAGGRGTTETKIDINTNHNECPNSNSEITETPPGFPNITELPPTSTAELDFYTHARKALSFRPPFVSDESQTSTASVSGANGLPNGLTHLLSRHSDGRKRHKKPHSGADKKSSAPRQPRAGILWTETDEYFRELTIEDIERLEEVSVGFSGNEKCFMIPCLDNDDSVRRRYDALNGLLMRFRDNDDSSIANANELNRNGMVKEMLVKEKNEQDSMDVDGDEGENGNLLINDENNGEKRENDEKKLSSFSGVEWILGSRNKIYLASERPSKKRKLLGTDAGLEKLLVARPIADLDYICHYCSYGENGDPLNCLIKCSSCGMVVHQRCYGVEEEVNSSWLCSWCKFKDTLGLTSERPCLLCPKQGGALKPVCKTGFGSEDESSEVEFAHLFCCQWIPEVYLENTRSMEPIMNLDKLKNVRRKSVCTLCKVKCGACVWCSNGACRTSFHPICAREATYRMEIWGKLGCDEVELRAYCSKHSEVQHDSSSQNAEDVSSAADKDLSKLDDILMDKEALLDNNGPSSGPHHVDKEAVDRNDNEDVNAYGALNFTFILKKLIDMRKVDAKDVALEIGVAPGSLNSILTDNHMAPELQCKIVKWLKNHAHIASLQKTLKVKIKPIVIPDAVVDVAEGASSVSVEKSDIADTVPVKSVPHRRRTKGNMRISGDEKSSRGKEKVDLTTEQGGDMCVRGGEDLNGPLGEFLPGLTKVVIDPVLHEDSSLSEPLKIGDEMSSDLSQCHGLAREIQKSKQMTTHSLLVTNGEFVAGSYVHPFIYHKLLQTENGMLEKTVDYEFSDLTDREVSQFEASSSSGHCCHNHSLRATSGGGLSESDRESLDQLIKARNLSMLKLSPEDDVEGELIYYQQRLLSNVVTKRHLCDDVVMKVVRSLPQELDDVRNKKWDAVFICQYNHELRETKKQGRKERRHREAQAILAAATAAAAASSRISSFRKDTLEESAHQEELLKTNAFDLRPEVYSQLNPRVKETLSTSAVARSSLDTTCDTFNLASDISKELPRTCDICRHSETILNPILVCSRCKVTVHLDCYRSIKNSTVPWHCELCEELFSSQGPGASTTYSLFAECVLCGGTAGAFRKSVDGQWVHALCAEWVLEATYKRGQVNPIQRMETVCKGVDSCIVCSRKQGVCLKCSYGHCQTTFHPTCARSSAFHMTVHTVGGKAQHKAYCEKHSSEQKAKVFYFRVSDHGFLFFVWSYLLLVFLPFKMKIYDFFSWAIDRTYSNIMIFICEIITRALFIYNPPTLGYLMSYTFYSGREFGFESNFLYSGSLFYVFITYIGLTFIHVCVWQVELERLRLLCERIIKREKLKRELVTCSHHILASSRDSVLSALARHPFYQPEISSESATTSIQGYTDGYKSGSEIVQRSDDITVDSTVAGKRRIKISISMDNQRPAYSSASQNLHLPKPMERVSVSGKQTPHIDSFVPRNPSDDVEKHYKYNKHTETFEKELVMTSDQASMKNQRLPKGFVYVPVQCLSKDKETVPDASSGEPMERNV